MNSEEKLPDWLDDYIFKDLGASYNPQCHEAEYNLDADEQKVKVYLGTYFPRSYCELTCIAENLFQNPIYRTLLTDDGSRKEEINILDIGCGTGGDIAGLLKCLDRYLPRTVVINVYAFDGNGISLQYMERVVKAFADRIHCAVKIYPKCLRINSEWDLLSLSLHVALVQFDYILCCKMCGELRLKNAVEHPYSSVAEKFSAMLKPNGLMLILDLTNRPAGCNQYLPREMNFELNSFLASHNEFGTLVPKPCGEPPQCKANCYMQKQFMIYFSKYQGKETNVCYRIICRHELRNKLVPDSVLSKKQVIREDICASLTCPRSSGDVKADAFDINA